MTGSQASTALKNGEINDTILKAYNDANGTSYTMDNPPPVYKKVAPLSEKEVKEWVDYLNNKIKKEYPNFTVTALEQDGKNKYKKGANVGADWIALEVFGSDDLTQAQKEYLMYDVFQIDPKHINSMLNENQSRYQKR